MGDPVDPVSAVADATREVARTAGKAVDAGRELGGWVDGLIGDPLREAIGWAITDNLRGGRAEAQVRRAARLRVLVHETEKSLRLRGIENLHAPGDKILQPLIEAAALEDDETLQRLWAELLASALSDQDELDRGFISILQDFSKADAEAFTGLYKSPNATWYGDVHVSRNRIFSWRKLYRLGLIEPSPEKVMLPSEIHRTFEKGRVDVKQMELPGNLERVRLTETGRTFGALVGIGRST